MLRGVLPFNQSQIPAPGEKCDKAQSSRDDWATFSCNYLDSIEGSAMATEEQTFSLR